MVDGIDGKPVVCKKGKAVFHDTGYGSLEDMAPVGHPDEPYVAYFLVEKKVVATRECKNLSVKHLKKIVQSV